MTDVVVVAYGRSAVGKAGKGYYSTMHPADLAGQVLQGTVRKIPQLNPAEIDDVIYGCANPVHVQTYDIARLAALRAGLPKEVPGITVSRFCSSSLDAISLAASKIMAGEAEVMAAGGVEVMSTTPVRGKEIQCPWLVDHVKDMYLPVGLAGENTAIEYGVTREEMARLAVESHRKAAAAMAAGRLDKEIVPVTIAGEDGRSITATKDQGVRGDATLEGILALKPAFSDNGLLTAGTSSQRSDGSGCVVLMSAKKAEQLKLKPIARYVGTAAVADTPSLLTPGLINAIAKLKKQTGMSPNDMDVLEINEAFASVIASAVRILDLDEKKLNPNGGAMALGHPLGATGAILTCRALNELERIGGRYAMVAMCAAAGQGCAGIFERVS